MWVRLVKTSFLAVDKEVTFSHERKDGDTLVENDVIIEISGRSKSLLTAERAGLNFLQTLSSTATITHEYAAKISHTDCKILDTRKTIPGLRMAQKYAVTVGGGMNHRIGLFDAILIKENHIQACGSIKNALEQAYQLAAEDMLIEIEVESIEQMLEALSHGAKRIMLDNFTPKLMTEAVNINRDTSQPAELEASGNITLDNIVDYAQTGVDYISLGALTKHIRAIDLSMRLID
jgi:nicotinate-nucleotide pyrophosphorylase [carboxylating] (EC 2.4.2.19)